MNRENTEYKIFDITVHSYKYQHCGDGTFGYCHTKPAYVRPQGIMPEPPKHPDRFRAVDVTGGWHDAGDYGKYIPTAAVTVYQLMLLAEVFPEFVKDNPLLLSETGFELEWMLKMQDDDGGVYHKVNTYDFCGMIMPEEDRQPQLLYEKSTAAAAYFAGATAYICGLLERDSGLTSGCRFPEYTTLFRAAVNAGLYLERCLPLGEEVVPSVDKTGPYIPEKITTICYWAFAELFRLTRSRKWIELCSIFEEKNGFRCINSPLGWEDMSSAAVWALYRAGNAEFYKEQIVAEAERICRCSAEDEYGCALTEGEYLWGSNKFAAAYGLQLILAAGITEDDERRAVYMETAGKQLEYITGNNSIGKCFITGVGENSVKRPHHRVVVAGNMMIPGLLVGGPNDKAEDGCYAAGRGREGYVDHTDAYSCNEYAIDYNAPLVFLSGALSALKHIERGVNYGIKPAE